MNSLESHTNVFRHPGATKCSLPKLKHPIIKGKCGSTLAAGKSCRVECDQDDGYVAVSGSSKYKCSADGKTLVAKPTLKCEKSYYKTQANKGA